jgi:hypothetical protein
LKTGYLLTGVLILSLSLARGETQAAGVPTTDIPMKLDVKMAERLAYLACGPNLCPNNFNYGPLVAPPFFSFDVLNSAPVNGSFGYFAVNPWTGDVWALWGCYKISSPAALRMQAAIRKRFAPEEMKQYARLSALKPDCIVEDPPGYDVRP